MALDEYPRIIPDYGGSHYCVKCVWQEPGPKESLADRCVYIVRYSAKPFDVQCLCGYHLRKAQALTTN